MKKYLSALIVSSLLVSPFAASAKHCCQVRDPMEVMVPFYNVQANSDFYEGLKISYDLEKNSASEVVCFLNNIEKGFASYPTTSAEIPTQVTPDFGNNHLVVFTNSDPSINYIDVQMEKHYVSNKGIILLYAVETHKHNSYAQCFYVNKQTGISTSH